MTITKFVEYIPEAQRNYYISLLEDAIGDCKNEEAVKELKKMLLLLYTKEDTNPRHIIDMLEELKDEASYIKGVYLMVRGALLVAANYALIEVKEE